MRRAGGRAGSAGAGALCIDRSQRHARSGMRAVIMHARTCLRADRWQEVRSGRVLCDTAGYAVARVALGTTGYSACSQVPMADPWGLPEYPPGLPRPGTPPWVLCEPARSAGSPASRAARTPTRRTCAGTAATRRAAAALDRAPGATAVQDAQHVARSVKRAPGWRLSERRGCPGPKQTLSTVPMRHRNKRHRAVLHADFRLLAKRGRG
jgi:hypothetical protein